MSLSFCPDTLLGMLKPDAPMAGELQLLSPGPSVFGDGWLLARPSKDQTGGTSIIFRGPSHGRVLLLLLFRLGDTQTRGHKPLPWKCPTPGLQRGWWHGGIQGQAGAAASSGAHPQEAVPMGICGSKSRGKGQGDKNRARIYGAAGDEHREAVMDTGGL